jgi:hypothetical protein
MTRRVRGPIAIAGGAVGSFSIVGTAVTTITSGSNFILDAAGTGNVTVSDVLSVTNSTNATTTTSGAIQVANGGIGIGGGLYVAGTLNVGGAAGINNTPVGASVSSSGAFTSLTATDLSTFSPVLDIVATKTAATGTVTHDFTEANIWYHSSISANFTVNLINTPTTNNRTISISLLLAQGGTPYYANAFQIDGSAQTIRWVGSVTPTPTANRTEIQTFTLVRAGSSWLVTSSLSSHGLPLDGSTSALAAPSAQYIKTYYPAAASGNYWIKPPGQTAYQVYCDMTNQGGGWMCVAVGREGGGTSGQNNWWDDNGAGSYSNSLQSGNLSGSGNYNPRYMPAAWIRAATGGTGTWADIEMIVNRTEINDSFYMRGIQAGSNANLFRWSDFAGRVTSGTVAISGGAITTSTYLGQNQIDNGTAPFYLNSARYSAVWLGGSLTNQQYGNWTDYDSNGGNGDGRLFTWAWSGHGSGTAPRNAPGSGNHLTGWSAGSTRATPGRQIGSEGHALQFVNVFVR